MLTGFCVQAQLNPEQTYTKKTSYIELGATMTSYRGDLVSSYGKYSSCFQVGIRFNKRKRINGHLGIGIGKIYGSNSNYSYTSSNSQIAPVTSFQTPFQYIEYDLNLNLFRRKHFILYFSQGIGLMNFTPKNSDGDNLINISNTRAVDETYSNVSFVLPTFLGIIYTFNNEYGVGFKMGFLNQTTDYMDNISELSNSSTKDNLLMIQLNVFAPITLPHSHRAQVKK